MTNTSDRAYFLETIKTEPLTINQVIERFGCARNTARLWVKHEEVTTIPGSWPTQYVRKDNLVPAGIPTGKAPAPNGILRYDIPEPSAEEKEFFFRKVLAAEVTLDFVGDFRAAESQKDIKSIIAKLKSALVVSEYYISLMKKEGMP